MAKDRAGGGDADPGIEPFLRRAGMEVPEARRKGLVAVHDGLMKAVALLHRPRPVSDWTASVHRMDTITRAKNDTE